MFGAAKTRIYTAHVNAEKADPADRVEIVREGFAFWAFLFHIFWLLYNRLWLATLGYIAILAMLMYLAQAFHLSEISVGFLQLWLQVMLGFTAHDLQRAKLRRGGYEMESIIVADSDLSAQRRYHDSHPAIA